MEQAPHDHTLEHLHTRTSITSPRWTKVASLGNYASAVLQGVAGIATGQVGSIVDSMHNVVDGYGYGKEGQNLHNTELSEQQRLRNRKIIFWLFSSTSLVLGTKAGVEICLNDEPDPSMLTVYSASASVGLNTILFGGMYKRIHERRKAQPDQKQGYTADEKMQLKHFFGLDVPSSVLSLIGAAGQYHHPSAGNIAGVVSGILGIRLFRPTKKNIRQECHHGSGHGHHEEPATHEHGHHMHDQDHEHVPVPPVATEQKNTLRNRLRRRVAAAALAFGALAGTTILTDSVVTERRAESIHESTQEPQPPLTLSPRLPFFIPEVVPPATPPPTQLPQQRLENMRMVADGTNTLVIHQLPDGSITHIEGVLGEGESAWTITEAAHTAVGLTASSEVIGQANAFMGDTQKQTQATLLQPGHTFNWIFQNGTLMPS